MIIANWIALCLVLAGALNWLTIGLFSFNLVEFICFGSLMAANIVYVLVGIACLFLIVSLILNAGRLALKMNDRTDVL